MLITAAVLSVFACIYYLSRAISCGCWRRRGWRRLRATNDTEMHEAVFDMDWMDLDSTEKGARSPHQE